MNETTLLRTKEVLARTGMSRTGLYEAMRKGFPKPARLGRRLVFSSAEVNRWIADTLSQRETK